MVLAFLDKAQGRERSEREECVALSQDPRERQTRVAEAAHQDGWNRIAADTEMAMHDYADRRWEMVHRGMSGTAPSQQESVGQC